MDQGVGQRRMIGLVAAMDAEVRSVRRHFEFGPETREGVLSFQKGSTREGQEFVLALSGIGRANARKATERLLAEFPVSGIVSFGVAGALVPGFALGEIAIVSSLVNEAGDQITCDHDLRTAATKVVEDLRLPHRTAVSLTVDRVISEPAEKARLHQETGAKIVEMESFAVAEAATSAGVPVAVLRAISDLDETRLPDFSKFMHEFRISRRRLALHLASHPGDIRPLIHFFSVTSSASAGFARIFERLLPRLAVEAAV